MVEWAMEAIWAIEKEDYKVRLYWVPGYSGIVGNEAVDVLAREASESLTAQASMAELCCADLGRDWALSDEHWRGTFDKTITGRFTKEIDKALP